MASQWYYSRGGERFGPISAEELKRLASTGEVVASDLVWNETLTDWVPATRIKGLFPAGASGIQQQPAAPPQAASSQPAAASGIGKATQAAPPSSAPPQAAAAAPQVAASDPVHQRLATPTGHVLDGLLQAVRDMASANTLRSAASGIAQIGGFALLGAIVVSLILRIMVVVKSERYSLILTALSMALVFLALHYVAGKLCRRIEELIRGTPTELASRTFLSCLALVFVAFGIFSLVNAAVLAYESGSWSPVGYGIAVFVIAEFVACTILHPPLVNVTVVERDITAGQEAIQLLYFLMKLVAYAVPVIFGMMVLVGAERLVWALVYFIQEKYGSYSQAHADGSLYLIIGGLTPLVGYFLFIVDQLVIDIIRAILAVPSKLDILASIGRGEDSTGDE